MTIDIFGFRKAALRYKELYEEADKRRWNLVNNYPSFRFVFGDEINGIVVEEPMLCSQIMRVQIGEKMICEYDDREYVVKEFCGFINNVFKFKLELANDTKRNK